MIMRWRFLAALLVSPMAMAGTEVQERAEYLLQWWVGKDGTSTKAYTVKYSGPETLRRLKEFSQGVKGAEGFLSNLLPYREPGDALVEFKSDGTNEFRWIYRARAQSTAGDNKDNLLLWLPVWGDPVSHAWEPKAGSRVRFRTRKFQIVNRIEVRVPWEFESPAPRTDHLLSQNHIEAHYKSRPIIDPSTGDRKIPGWDQPGIELSSDIETTEGELTRETINRLHEAHSSWVMARLSGVLWARVARDPVELAYGKDPHGAGSFDVGYNWINAGSSSYRGVIFSLGTRRERYLGAGFTWRSIGLDARLSLGSDQGNFTDIRVALSSILQYRLKTLSGLGEGERQVTFFDLYAGPAAQYVWLNDSGTGVFNQGLAPGAMAGIRWGLANSKVTLMAGTPFHVALGLRWEGLNASQLGGSRLALLMELF